MDKKNSSGSSNKRQIMPVNQQLSGQSQGKQYQGSQYQENMHHDNQYQGNQYQGNQYLGNQLHGEQPMGKHYMGSQQPPYSQFAGMSSFSHSAMQPAMQPSVQQAMQPAMQPVTPAFSSLPALPSLPTGIPSGPAFAPIPSTVPPGTHISAAPPLAAAPPGSPSPTTVDNLLYTPAYMRTQIGRRVKVEFLIGTSMLVDREGTLVAVGASYIIIQESETDDLLLCDLYSIKFVKFYY